jgi:hypothetical protein
MEAQAYSRFVQTSPVLYDGNETYGRWNSPITSTIYDNLVLVVVGARYEGRPDLLAYELYGDSSLDWVLITVNNATEALNWPRAGDTIKVPSSSTITSELL